jgi:hypothetical protein
MEALKTASVVDGGNKNESVHAPAAGLILDTISVFRRLKMPGVRPLSSQIASKQSLERFELMLQCGF